MTAEDDDEYFEIEEVEKTTVIPDEIRRIAEKGKVIESFPFCVGCGSLLGLKIALQELGKAVVIATGHIAMLGKYPRLSLQVPLINASNPAAVAKILSKNTKIIVFAGDGTTHRTWQTILRCAKDDNNFIYICNNNQSFSQLPIEKSFSDKLEATYSASASLGYLADYIQKLRGAKEKTGFRFIDLICPCPAAWGFDPSLTIDVAKMAVDTNFWPLFERVKEKKKATFTPSRIEPIERYLEMQGRYRNIAEEKVRFLREKASALH